MTKLLNSIFLHSIFKMAPFGIEFALFLHACHHFKVMQKSHIYIFTMKWYFLFYHTVCLRFLFGI